MKAGFAKFDITPRVGVSMAGFGPFLNRNATFIRDRIDARAAAIASPRGKALIISCDLCTIYPETTRLIREIIAEKITALSPDEILVTATHTHSAPAVVLNNCGWGSTDLPYLQLLPYKIAQAGIDAWNNLEDVSVSTARVPCRHIGLNRVYDVDKPPLEEVLDENWEPAKPELTDTECQVIRFDDAKGNLKGFMVNFGCHAVVCCQKCHYIHGDYPGVAIHGIMREYPGSIGLFLQGAEGDVNSGCVHKPEQESLLALDVFAGRFARAIRHGLAEAKPIDGDEIATARLTVEFSTIRNWTEEALLEKKREIDAVLNRADVSDDDKDVRMNTVFRIGLEKLMKLLRSGANTNIIADVFAVKMGPVEFLGAPFEIMQAIKNDAVARAKAPIPLVLSLCNGAYGYAPDQQAIDKADSYEATRIPLMQGRFPYANIHRELVEAFLELDGKLYR
ncbi:MAG: neutral/alkaline non-lysosomal ceramidase N-terminal domain-containing protein [Lentisphaeria bacterium]|nr:neutral/alkaline non-lysosomal ceramidase N-terminal domain-containing protein [Lentisphaeria bacterium]